MAPDIAGEATVERPAQRLDLTRCERFGLWLLLKPAALSMHKEQDMPEKNQSVEMETRALPETNWEDIVEAGAYVEKSTGDLFRIPKEALIKGASPIIMREGSRSPRLVQVSRDPFVTVLEARHRCAQHNITPNF